MHPDGPLIFFATGAPHFGHVAALVDTCSPHSLQFIKAINSPFINIGKSNRDRVGNK